MIKGTTPTHKFSVPAEVVGKIKEIKITYEQNGVDIITKRTEDCTVSGDEVSVRLTQTDTFMFDHEAVVNIQIRILTVNGDALASFPLQVNAVECLDDEVLQ